MRVVDLGEGAVRAVLAGVAVAVLAACGLDADVAAGPAEPGCIGYSAAVVEQVTGVAVQEIRGAPIQEGSARGTGCSYLGPDGFNLAVLRMTDGPTRVFTDEAGESVTHDERLELGDRARYQVINEGRARMVAVEEGNQITVLNLFLFGPREVEEETARAWLMDLLEVRADS